MSLRMRIGFSMTLAAFATFACGDKTDSSSAGGASSVGGSSGAAAVSGASTGGSNATAGESGTEGGSAGAGIAHGGSAGNAHGGAVGTGGKNPTAGGSSVAGASSCGGGTSGSGSLPTGDVDACFGQACPFGQCDNGSIAAPTRCDDVYSGPVCGASMHCATGASGSHCLTVVTATAVEYWVVTCTSGTAAGNLCSGGCGIVGGQATCI